MRKLTPLLSATALCLALAPTLHAATPTLVLWAARATVDTDGDLTPDLTDFAPGVPDNQMDTDNDHIGDIIDPTPNSSNPYLGDPGLGITGPYTINAGDHLFVDYLMTLAAPPGNWGYIDLDLGGDGTYDATYFGPLDPTFNSIDIPPSFFTSPLWDLNTPGTYELHALAYGPAMHSDNYTITNAVVVPEPTTFLPAAPLLLATRRKR